MTSSFLAVCSLLVVSLTSGVNCQDITNGYFPYKAMLDDNFQLGWNFNDTHIVFEVCVKTNGYVGFGISGSGSMYPSDLIIGWVKDGQVYFSDRHATGYFMPAIDDSQDWFLLDGTEDGDYTTLSMIRELVTCDDHDMPITTALTHLIYSYHPMDPSSETTVPYHGPTRRGTKAVHLLIPDPWTRTPKPLPSDAMFVDFLNRNYSVPTKDTMYSCTTWKLPELDGKHHIIKYEPVIQEGHELLVHHMILYSCAVPLAADFVGIQYECYGNGLLAEAFMDCHHVYIGVAIGGGAVEIPDHVGLPLGTALDPTHFILETHYDNPAMRSDFVDSSGIRITLTKELRPNDGGMLEVGIQVSEFPIVPPFNSDFMAQGFCQEECIEQGMEDQEEIYVIGNLLHSHLMGRKLRTRIIRGGVELPPLQENNYYDFNFQQHTLFPERVIKKGDSLIMECEYDSSDRQTLSFGGLSTRDEMCLSFVMYYPRVRLTTCLSKPHFEGSPETKKETLGALYFANWTDPRLQDSFRLQMQQSPIQNICLGGAIAFDFDAKVTPRPTVTDIYAPPQSC